MITQKQLGAKIKALREGLALTQEFVAKKIGLGRQAVLAIESGKRGIDGVELAKLAEVLKTSIDFLLMQAENISKSLEVINKPKIYFDKKKLRNLILYALARCGGKPNVGETVLYKLFYFIDFDSFETAGKPIVGLKYLKFQYGPVPGNNEYQQVISEMQGKGELKIIKQNYGSFFQKKYVAFAEPDADAFSYEELMLINSVLDRLSGMTARQITEYVHEDAPWKFSPVGSVIDYRLVFERTAPFARVDREEVWQNAAGTDVLKALGKMSKEELDYYQKL